jgi:hypothetical protein
LTDDPPVVTVQDPGNTTFWKYDLDYTVDIATSQDNHPGESFTCWFYNDGDQIGTRSGTGSATLTGSFRQDLQDAVNFTAECGDDAGNTTDTSFYSVDDINVTHLQAVDQTWETFNESFETDVYQGAMVDQVEFGLIWNGSQVASNVQGLDDQGTMAEDLDHTIPVVPVNATSYDWRFNYTLTVENFTDSSQNYTKEVSSQVTAQDVWWSYWIQGSGPFDADIIEGQDMGHRVNVTNRSGSADLSGSMNWTRNTDLVAMDQDQVQSDRVQFTARDFSGKVNTTSRTDTVNSTVTVAFQGDERDIWTDDTVTTHQIRFDDCGTLSTQALKFEVFNERNRSDRLESDLDLDVEIWRDPSVTREFSFSSDGQQTHTFCIAPSWAEYTVRSAEERRIQYQDTAENYRLRSYFLMREQISSNTTDVELFTLKSGESARVEMETLGENGEQLAKTIIRAERYYPGTGEHESAVMGRTGEDGRTIMTYEIDEVEYRFKFYRMNESGWYRLVDTAPGQLVFDDLLQFEISGEDPVSYYEFREGIAYTCDSNATRVECDYSAEEGLNQVRLTVEKSQPIQRETVCERSTGTVSGSLTCTGLNATAHQYFWTLDAENQDGNWVILETSGLGDSIPGYGTEGLFMAFMLIVTLGLAAATIPEVAVALSALGMIVSYATGLVGIPYQAAASYVIVAAITIWLMRRKRGGGVGL